MLIDFTPVNRKEISLFDFAQRFTRDDLRAATHSSIDTMLDILQDMDDFQMTFIPDDPDADDPHAPPHERHQGWNLAHVVLHVTASSEEGAALSSMLARGIPIGVRLRYEPDWRHVKTRAEVIHRLEESRRIRLAYLDTWPDKPHLDVYRDYGPEAPPTLKSNALAAFFGGLRHEANHYEQLRKTVAQARQLAQTGVV